MTTKVLHQCVGKGQQGIKPLPLLSFSLNFSSLRLGEMLGQYVNGPKHHLKVTNLLLSFKSGRMVALRLTDLGSRERAVPKYSLQRSKTSLRSKLDQNPTERILDSDERAAAESAVLAPS